MYYENYASFTYKQMLQDNKRLAPAPAASRAVCGCKKNGTW
jgi:hypothetical protein